MAQVANTQEEIIERFKKVHGDRYDYKDVVYTRRDVNVTIWCKKHNISFQQTPSNHLQGKGCPSCSLEKKGTSRAVGQSEFIKGFIKRHGDKYNYDKVSLKTGSDHITITCPIHGDFTQRAYNHLYGKGCPKCGLINPGVKRDTDMFIQDSKKIHGDRYDYSLSKFTTVNTAVKIICPKHGVFLQIPKVHLKGSGCPECAKLKQRLPSDEYINKAKEKHNNKYDYSNTVFNGMFKPVTYVCPNHGPITQRADGHLKYGCFKCHVDKITKSKDSFIDELKDMYGDKYILDKVNYINNATNITVGCREHGYFNKLPYDLLRGGGCPICSSSANEKRIFNWLTKYNFEFIKEYKVDTSNLRYDFFIPELKLLIEFHGKQHYQPVDGMGGENTHDYVVNNDRIKRTLASQLGLDLLVIDYRNSDSLEQFLIDELSTRIRYKRDGKYFRNFFSYAKYFNLPDDATLDTASPYKYDLRTDLEAL